MISANVQLGPLLKKLRQVPREAAAIMAKAIEDDARGFVRDIAAITPPSMDKANPASKKRGEAAVMRDVWKVYVTPGKLYAIIKARDEKLAAGFWAAVKHKNWPQAARICKTLGLKELIDFGSDDGAAHEARRGRDGRVRGDKPSEYVRDPRYVKSYIKQMQSRVGLLASGFAPAAARLKTSLPAWITRHRQNVGSITVIPRPDKFTIIITNRARHGRANDLSRRMQWVLKSGKRHKRLQNSIRFGIRAALKKSRLQVA
jgi:hypothetical protein